MFRLKEIWFFYRIVYHLVRFLVLPDMSLIKWANSGTVVGIFFLIPTFVFLGLFNPFLKNLFIYWNTISYADRWFLIVQTVGLEINPTHQPSSIWFSFDTNSWLNGKSTRIRVSFRCVTLVAFINFASKIDTIF